MPVKMFLFISGKSSIKAKAVYNWLSKGILLHIRPVVPLNVYLIGKVMVTLSIGNVATTMLQVAR